MRPARELPGGASATPIYDALYAEYRRLFRALPGDHSGEEGLRFTAFGTGPRGSLPDRYGSGAYGSTPSGMTGGLSSGGHGSAQHGAAHPDARHSPGYDPGPRYEARPGPDRTAPAHPTGMVPVWQTGGRHGSHLPALPPARRREP
ncbi:hypothetical protein ACFWIA_19205 [Streptomyces sp. NPDC127068]|uniref:hypothetical protein n=1 Tax=Streptomyces sp. NPDC127068 TaxID=3347127 RepID=UPI003667103E